jgi:hypothetical protein
MTPGQDKFTFDFHLADHAGLAVIDMGETDYENFIKEFTNFPWLDQLEIANRLKNTSATITVQDSLNKTELWTSIAGNRDDHGFIVGYNFPKIIKGNLFRKERTVKWVIMYATEVKEKIVNCYNLFFKRNTPGLIQELEQLYFYGETEAHKQNFKPRQ